MQLKEVLPLAARDRLRNVWFRWLKWPAPVWRLRGYGYFRVGDQTIAVHDVADSPNDWWSRQAQRGAHEPEVGAFLAEHVRHDDVFFDVGANFGQYALFAGMAGAVVHAFEPDPAVQLALARNVQTNGLQHRVTVVAAAVSDQAGWMDLDLEDLGTPTSRLAQDGAGLAVRTLRLDDYCAEVGVRPDVMKVDIEGAEALALTDAAHSTLDGLRAFVVEIHEGWIRERGHDPDELVARLAEGRSVVRLGGRWDGNYNVGFLRR